MVRKVFGIISSQLVSLREAAFWLAVFSLISQLIALGRDRLLAHNFGAGLSLDIYYASFKIPDLLFVTVASLVSISALVPLFARKQSEGEKHLKDATDSIFTVFFFLILFFCILAFFLIPYIIPFVFATFDLEAKLQIIKLSRILLLSPLLLGLSNFFGSIVQYQNRFILYSISPILYNIGIIAGITFGLEKLGMLAVVLGVVFGAVLHLLLQAAFVINSNLKPVFTFRIKWKDVWETATLSIPRTLALSIVSFVSFVFVVLAGRLGEGAIAIFNFAFNLQSAPLSLVGVSLSLAAFPSLAISAARKDIGEVVSKITEGLRYIIFFSIPITALTIVLRAHIVRVVLGSGVFDWSATRLTAAVFALFVLSSVFQGIQLFLSRSHYAIGKTRLPLLGNIIGGVVSVLFAILFIKYFENFTGFLNLVSGWLKISDLRISVLILPLTFSLGTLVSSVILFLGLGKDIYNEIYHSLKTTIYQSIFVSICTALSAYITLNIFDSLFDLDTFIGVLSHGLLSGVIGITVGIVVLHFLHNKEYKDIVINLKRKYSEQKTQ